MIREEYESLFLGKKTTNRIIAEKFNTHRFADYKEQVLDLLKRVCTVSVETMKVVREMGDKLKSIK